MTKDKDITPAMLLKYLGKKMDDMEKRLNKRFDGMYDQLIEIEARLANLKSGMILLFTQTDNINGHLNDLEGMQIRKIKKSIRNIQKRFKTEEQLRSRTKVQA